MTGMYGPKSIITHSGKGFYEGITMIELGPGADVLRGMGILTWLLIIGTLVWAWTKPRTRRGKYFAVATVLGLLIAFPGRWTWERHQAISSYRAALQKARAIFQERCKNAGEKVYRTVDGVEGLVLLRVRKRIDPQYQSLEDPFGSNSNPSEENYITSFLAPRDKEKNVMFGWWKDHSTITTNAYDFVDVLDDETTQVHRYSGHQTSFSTNPDHIKFQLKKAIAPKTSVRYAVVFEDLTTLEEREKWIAGSAFRVIDLTTGEVLGERIGYFMDEGLGSRATQRVPWIQAQQWACPSFSIGGFYRGTWDRDFVEKILKPIQK